MTDVATLSDELMSEATTRYIVSAKRHGDVGGQLVYRFRNGWGASVVRYGFRSRDGSLLGTYGVADGLFELGVARFSDDGDDAIWALDQNHPLVRDDGGVLGHLTAQDVERVLVQLMRSAPADPLS